MADLFEQLQQDLNEQLAGTTPPVEFPKQAQPPMPAPLWPQTEGREL